ncbi:sulfonate ABC transporter substrate-binding protein [Virgibacillus alimentarius]|uniref:Sulfonate transport system substrate-binding protein n=1 Tax=Virgibacillus alimentarius TaxID=698769 RepID=A0ABS4S6A0_9BACI|nr:MULTISPECIES: sulfonate ABC transporter substrate-binding protein [Virgibacillus]MBP2257005.1 sulfonate transport system substrate-binding protein [Virgibacillus alimentarius]HLR68009.1 sulfonate ABC transporter substrate-binding protein [Virgibacillus sp.]
MRKILIAALVSLFVMVIVIGCSKEGSTDEDTDQVVRIGYQKNGPLVILKSLGNLDERLKEEGWEVEWKEFQAGPALVEALNAGGIDVGRTGNSPPIFAQAADAPFTTLAAGKSKFYGSGILVPEDSDITSVSDLKDKKVSFAKGSSSHFLIVKALEEAGLKYEDIHPEFLTPGDARVAFEQGNIDAMVVWDPYTASTEINSGGKLLINGEGISTDRDFFLATNDFADQHADITEIIMEEVEDSSEWANNNHEELIEMLSPILKIDEASIKKSIERREYGVDEINDKIIKEQQEIADTFYQLNIIPKEIHVKDVME